MVKVFTTVMLLAAISFGNVFEKECAKCHKNGPSLKKIYFDYLLKYSSEKRVKRAMIDFLKNPTIKNSIMPKSYIKKHGIKKKTKLPDTKLKEAIDIYWKKFTIKGKIK